MLSPRVPQVERECPICKQTYQLRHFRLLRRCREQREEICQGCSQQHKKVKALVKEGVPLHQCDPMLSSIAQQRTWSPGINLQDLR